MDRLGILQALRKRYNYKTFLEIGVREGYCFTYLNIGYKDGVDIKDGPGNYKMTSDKFFEELNENTRYDLVHVDGWHSYDQSKKDILNSLDHLSEGGSITVHDVLPSCKENAREDGNMNGEVWKTIVELRCTRPDLKIYTINTDHGCAFIQKGKQDIYTKVPLGTCLEWKYKERNKKELLNVISIAEFKDLLVGDGFTNQDF